MSTCAAYTCQHCGSNLRREYHWDFCPDHSAAASDTCASSDREPLGDSTLWD